MCFPRSIITDWVGGGGLKLSMHVRVAKSKALGLSSVWPLNFY